MVTCMIFTIFRCTLQSFHSKHKVTRHLCVIIIINLVAWYLWFHVQYSVRNMFMTALKLKVLYIRPDWLGTNGHWTGHGPLVSSFLSIFLIIKNFFPWFLICLKRCNCWKVQKHGTRYFWIYCQNKTNFSISPRYSMLLPFPHVLSIRETVLSQHEMHVHVFTLTKVT
jgi:hypothetical protein